MQGKEKIENADFCQTKNVEEEPMSQYSKIEIDLPNKLEPSEKKIKDKHIEAGFVVQISDSFFSESNSSSDYEEKISVSDDYMDLENFSS